MASYSGMKKILDRTISNLAWGLFSNGADRPIPWVVVEAVGKDLDTEDYVYIRADSIVFMGAVCHPSSIVALA